MERRSSNKRSKKRVQPRKAGGGPKEPIWMGPPTYKQQVIREWRIRGDVAANAASQTVTAGQLGSYLGIIATSAVASVYISPSFRIKSIQMWSYTGTIGTTVDISLKWSDTATAGGLGGPPQTVADSSASVDKPAYVSLHADKFTVFQQWFNNASANSMLTWYSPQQSIMDIVFEFFLDDLGVLVAGPVIAAATLGTLYHHNIATLTAVQPLNSI